MIGKTKLQMRQDIGLAISTNTKTWKRYSSNPVLSPSDAGKDWDSDLVCHSTVIKHNKKFYMFYDGSPKKAWKEAIGIATSDDLLSWQKLKENPVLRNGSYWWDSHHVSRCSVMKAKNVFYMFYAGHDGVCERIGIAKSRDLITWKKLSRKPILDLGKVGEWDDRFVSDPKVIRVGNYYLMSYTGLKEPNSEISKTLANSHFTHAKGGVGIAYSKNLINWKKFSQNPILESGKKGSWDQDEASRADFVKTGGKFYLFYTGVNGFKYSIGIAEVKMDKLLKAIKNEK